MIRARVQDHRVLHPQILRLLQYQTAPPTIAEAHRARQCPTVTQAWPQANSSPPSQIAALAALEDPNPLRPLSVTAAAPAQAQHLRARQEPPLAPAQALERRLLHPQTPTRIAQTRAPGPKALQYPTAAQALGQAKPRPIPCPTTAMRAQVLSPRHTQCRTVPPLYRNPQPCRTRAVGQARA